MPTSITYPVPTPDRCAVTKRRARTSVIHSRCASRSASASQSRAGPRSKFSPTVTSSIAGPSAVERVARPDATVPLRGGRMKALVFRHNFAREAVARVRSALGHRAYVEPPAPTRLEDVPEPEPPAPDWVLCDTAVAGICGSDTKQIFLNGRLANPLTPLLSFPQVLGHEAVARRSATGDRVVLTPWLSCVPRGIDPPCAACAEGRYPSCRSFDQGAVSAALHLGNCAAAPGVHAERFSAHTGQLFRVPETVGDDAAVLADPASVSLRTILLHPPHPSAPALVYGCGTLAAAAVGLLRHLYPDVEVWVVSRSGARAELAERMGAHQVLPSKPDELVAEVARRAGVRPLVPWSKHAW